MRDLDASGPHGRRHGPAVGAYAAAVLDHPLPWTKMRQVYALLGLVKRWGADRVDAACARALEAEAVSVGLIGRMLERGTETTPAEAPAPLPSRPARPASPGTPTTSPRSDRPGTATATPPAVRHEPRRPLSRRS